MAMDPARLRPLNGHAQAARGEYVLYWMIAARRPRHSFGLDHAVALARAVGKPLLVLEALRVGYKWASDRLHAFVLAGMADNAAAFAKAGVTYLPYVEPTPGAGKGLVEHLAARAVCVVTDDFPTFFIPRMLAAIGSRLPVAAVAVDGNGLLPMRLTDQVFSTAMAFRRHLQRELAGQLTWMPQAQPLESKGLGGAEPPRGTLSRWPMASAALLAARPAALAALPIDHSVAPAPLVGGHVAAGKRLAAFVADGLMQYTEKRQNPDDEGGSGLSPYLHFGHASVHEILRAVAAAHGWTPTELEPRAHGRRDGFWRLPQPVEAFLDELVTWREVGYNFCALREDHERYESLPEWAQKSLDERISDRRVHLYDLATLEGSRTHDEVWNAAQRQLVLEGRMHNYLRMLWGKKILEWSESPRAALDVMFELNNKYALDGRNPNSVTGIMWTLGRYDRPWAPRRDIFGVIRYMSSQNTVKKLDVKRYLARWAPGATATAAPTAPRQLELGGA